MAQPPSSSAEGHPAGGGANHVIWGDVESNSIISGTSSGHSGSLSGLGSEARQERRKRIVNRKIKAGELQLCNNSNSGCSDSEESSSSRSWYDMTFPDSEDIRRRAAGGPAPVGLQMGSRRADTDTEAEDEIPPGPLPSVGSAAHLKGNCKPCLFLFEAMGCKTGDQCPFCHYPHQKNAARHSKGKRDRFRKLVSRMMADDRDPTEEAQQPLEVGLVRTDVPDDQKQLVSL